jgi:hypothetical protein
LDDIAAVVDGFVISQRIPEHVFQNRRATSCGATAEQVEQRIRSMAPEYIQVVKRLFICCK